MSHNIEHAGETRVAASGNNRRPATNNRQRNKKKGAASYSPALHRSTIGAGGLNFSVRDGKRWDTAAIATRKGVDLHDKQGPITNGRSAQKRGGKRRLPSGDKTSRRKGTARGKAFGQLVALGFGVAAFTPAPYRRPRLGRPS